MNQFLARIALVVEDYDGALEFYVKKLGFQLIEDTPLPEEGDKRWVVVRPPGSGPSGCALLLAKAKNGVQRQSIGHQTGGRVGFFLFTDDFARDHANLLAHNVKIVRPPTDFPYGRVLVFADLYGNLWDLVQPSNNAVI